MSKTEAPEWFQILVIAIIAAALFPTAFVAIFNSILMAIVIGIIVAIVIIGIWWYLESQNSGGI